MKKKTKILAILAVAVMMFTVMAISCFAYDVGTTITFKDTYTQEELEKYFTDYKDVEGVYYNSETSNFGYIFPDLLSLYESFSEIVCLYKGEGFVETTNDPNVPFIYLGKDAESGNIYIFYKYTHNLSCIFSGKTSAWSDGEIAELNYTSGTFTLTDEQFSTTGLLWTATSPNKTNGTLIDMLSSIGNGLKDFLPDVAEAGVDTVDTLFVTSDGKLTTFSTITIIGIVCASGRGIYSIIKRKTRKV